MNQQQQMNMAAMGAGGPVGGPAGPQMNNVGTPKTNQDQETTKKLNTAIYDYLLRNEWYGAAKEMMKATANIQFKDTKQSPNQRGQQANGIDDGMDLDSRESGFRNKPDDLPMPVNVGGDGPFLQDWWCQFWEVWAAHRNRNTPGAIGAYMNQQRTMSMQRGANMTNLNQQAMAANGMRGGFNPMMQANGVAMSNDLKRAAMQNNTRLNPQQMAQMQNMKNAAQNGQMMQAANQMERSNSQMDNRSGSPGSGDAPSPKRQRIDGGMQQMGQGRPGQPGQMQPNSQTVEVYSQSMSRQMQAAMNKANKPDSNVIKVLPPNMGPGGAQGSPMSQQGMDGATGEFYAATAAANGGPRIPMPGNAAAAAAAAPGQGNNGNHALQDYQMQLMLLEQQNKKRLLMARQEQDSMSSGHPGGVGPNGNFVPVSPPGPNMMDPNLPAQMRGQMVMGPNGAMPRPPSSHPGGNLTPAQMEMFQRGMPLPNGQFQPGPQGQMMPGQPGGPANGPQGARQANNMPPPPAPAANAGGTGPSSPSQQPAPPTPSTTNKAKPGNKKENAKKGAAAKKNAATATPATESEQPPTPTPATPITPMNPKSFNTQNNGQMPNGQPATVQAQLNAQANGPQQPAIPQPDPNANAEPFGSLDSSDQFGVMDMSLFNADSGDMLDNFDFDSFLNNDGDGGLGGFDANFAFDGTAIGNGIEGAN